MITRSEVIGTIFLEMGHAKAQGLVDLIKEKEVERVKALSDEFNFEEFKDWIEKYGYLNLKTNETTSDEEWILPLVIYIWKSGICDGRVFKYREAYRYLLQQNCGEIGKHIANLMHDRFLFEIPLEELLGV